MSIETTNLKLTKPLETENYDINIFNDNFDKIDDAVGNITTQQKDCAKNIKDIDGSNAYISDANNCGIVGKRTTHRTNYNTLNTPYKQGLTSGYVEGIVDTYLNSANFGIQIGYATGHELLKRSLISGTWSEWKQLATTEKIPILLTPNAGFKFISQNNYKINNVIHFNFRLAKSDDSVFSKDSFGAITLPSGILDTPCCLSSSGILPDNVWLGQTSCVLSPVNNVILINIVSDNIKQVMCTGSVVMI